MKSESCHYLKKGYLNIPENKDGVGLSNSTPLLSASYKKDEVILSAKTLEDKLGEVQDKQGVIGKIWGGFKNLSGLGISEKKVKEIIKKYKNNEITFEDAECEIIKYDTKQKGIQEGFSNLLSGLITAAVIGKTGKVNANYIIKGALIGGGIKTGIKSVERGTNNISGDILDIKQIGKDALTGAIDGAAMAGTMNMTKNVNNRTVAKETFKQTIKDGAIKGLKAGAITGALSGAGTYGADVIFEKDISFKPDEFIKTTVKSAAAGGIIGGAIGGVSSGYRYGKLSSISTANEEIALITDGIDEKASRELLENARIMDKRFLSEIDEVEAQYIEDFGNLSCVKDIQARSKSASSIYNKLVEAYKKGEKLHTTNIEDCMKIVEDGYGIRIQLKSLTKEETKEVLKKFNIDYTDFKRKVMSDEPLDGIYKKAYDALKEKETGEFVKKLQEIAGDPKKGFGENEFNNYGNSKTAYFSNKSLNDIGEAYSQGNNNRKFFVVNNSDPNSVQNAMSGNVEIMGDDDLFIKLYKDGIKKSNKKSGYTTAQGNLKHTDKNGITRCNVELQIRGEEVNALGDSEHIFYDISKGKITENHQDYSEIYNAAKHLTKESKKHYYEYLNQTYEYKRLKELGIITEKPVLKKDLFYQVSENSPIYRVDDKTKELFTEEGLRKLAKKACLAQEARKMAQKYSFRDFLNDIMKGNL